MSRCRACHGALDKDTGACLCEPVCSAPETLESAAETPAHHTKVTGKPRVDLLPPRAMLETAAVMTDTAGERDKPGRPGYLDATPADIDEYRGALGRHWLAYCAGDTSDKKSGRSHLAHMISNAAILLELELVNGNNNREDKI